MLNKSYLKWARVELRVNRARNRNFSQPPSTLPPLFSIPRPLRLSNLPSFGPELSSGSFYPTRFPRSPLKSKGHPPPPPRCWSLVRPISLLRPAAAAAGQDTFHSPPPLEMENERGLCAFPDKKLEEGIVSWSHFPPGRSFVSSYIYRETRERERIIGI